MAFNEKKEGTHGVPVSPNAERSVSTADAVTTKVFKTAYLAGELEFEEIDDYVDFWNKHDEDPRTLREFLGLNEEEEDAWISIGDEALQDLLDRQKK